MNKKFSKLWTELSAQEKIALAQRAHTSVAYLSQIATGHRNAGRKTIDSLVRADPKISLSMFFEAA